MGTVYKAYDPDSGREGALKVLGPPLAAFPEEKRRELVLRFEREAQLAASLDHPGIARVFQAGDTDGAPWIAMELVQGETLAQLVKREGKAPGFRSRAVAVVA